LRQAGSIVSAYGSVFENGSVSLVMWGRWCLVVEASASGSGFHRRLGLAIRCTVSAGTRYLVVFTPSHYSEVFCSDVTLCLPLEALITSYLLCHLAGCHFVLAVQITTTLNCLIFSSQEILHVDLPQSHQHWTQSFIRQSCVGTIR